VTFGGIQATSFAFLSATSVTASTPAHGAGAVGVVVTTPSGDSPAAAGATFTFESSTVPGPTVSGVAPSSGPVVGGTSVTITGTNLTGATGVTVGGAAATDVVVVNDTTVTATTPAHDAGAVGVVVTTPSGDSPAAAGATFTYVEAPPVCTTPSPIRSVRGAITITGAGRLTVDLTIVVLPFGLGSYSYGRVDYHSSSPRLEVVAPVLIGSSVARPTPTGCGVSFRVGAYDWARFPIRNGQLNVEYATATDSAPAQASISFLGTRQSGAVSSGTLTIG
jgi:hypothetical protein